MKESYGSAGLRSVTLRSLPPERWQRIESLFDAALDLDPSEREGRLAAWCDGDEELRRAVSALLACCDQPTRLPGADALPLFAQVTLESRGAQPALVRVGAYRIVRHLGSGGMGSVYLAERDDAQFHMRVALKLLRRVWSTQPGVVRRFVEERQILARLNHPNVARLLDGGVTEDGQPYLVLEYVEGEPLDRYCDARRLPVEDRLRLFCAVCEAVQYAHRNLVVHRDLKPTNLLVSAEGEVKLLDFGIAKLLSDEPAAGLTRTGERLLTPEYASPEQRRGDIVTTATDIYSLGVVLCELLTGVRPMLPSDREPGTRPGEVLSLGAAMMLDADADAGIAPPDVRAQARATTPQRLRRMLHGDLEAIVRKAMRDEPERRYATADQFAADVRRHLARLPVLARSDARGYRARRFLARHRSAVTVTALGFLLLLAATLSAHMQALEAARERDRATEALRITTSLLASADPRVTPGEEVTARDLLAHTAIRVERELANLPELQGELLSTLGRVHYGLGHYDRADTLLTRALSLQRRHLGARDPRLATTLQALGLLRAQQGEVDEAEALQREGLAIRRARLGPSHYLVVESLNGLGFAHRRRTDFVSAEVVYREAVRVGRDIPDPTESHHASALHGLAVSMRDPDSAAVAEALMREAIARMQQRTHGRHPELSIAMYNLGELLHRRGKLIEADSVIRVALEDDLHVYGARHPMIATDLRGLAAVRRDLGDPASAESLFRDALELQRASMPAGSVRLLPMLLGLGELLQELDRCDEAMVHLREASAIAEQRLPPADSRHQRAQLAMGRCAGRLASHR